MGYYNCTWIDVLPHHLGKMITKKQRKQAKEILKRILNDPAIADQYTEEEIEELEFIALDKEDD